MKPLSFFLLLNILLLSFALRFYKIGIVPPGLYIDEASIGYNAYLILQKGSDEYGVRYPLWFKSLGDYKLPVYIYTTTASIFLFGKNEFAVRFPSVFFGALTVLIVYLLTKELTVNKKLSLLTAFVFCITPWHLQFSRVGFETPMALFFFTASVWSAISFFRKKNILFFVFGFLFLVFSMYTHHSYRIITPVTYVAFSLYAYKQYGCRVKKPLLLITVFFLILSFPLFQSVFSIEGSARFSQTSAFFSYEELPILNKLQIYPVFFLKNYLSHFSSSFLFVSGDGIARHQMVGFGPLLKWQLPFVCLGIYGLIRNKKNNLLKQIIVFLVVISPVSAALTLPSPHTTRSFLLIIPISILTAYGIDFCLKIVKFVQLAKLVKFAFISLFIFEFSFYLHYYYLHYPKTAIIDWGGGYKDLVEKAASYRDKYPAIVVDDRLQYAYIYFLFYNDRLKPVFPGNNFDKTKIYGKTPVLYITPYLDTQTARPSDKLIDMVRLPNLNKDIFAQFWEI